MPRTLLLLCLVSAVACGPERRRGGGGGAGDGLPGNPNEGGDDVWTNPDLDPPAEGEGEPCPGGGQPPCGDDPAEIDPPPSGACAMEDAVESCGAPSMGACDPGWRWCREGAWTECVHFQPPAAEVCDDIDNDCDGVVDGESYGCAPFDREDPAAQASQIAALDHVNALRSAAGLPVVRFHPALNRASVNHAEYHRLNGGGHGEEPGDPGFTGANPGERAAHEGYDGPGGIFEDMAYGVGPVAAVDTWFHSVYHRVPIVKPDAVLLGFGSNAGVEVLNIAVDGQRSDLHALTPYDGERGVPLNFYSDREGPDPVVDANEVGYPISIVTASRGTRLREAVVIADGAGAPVELYEATAEGPHPGFLEDGVFVMSRTPLDANTWYTVRMVYVAGATFERTWRFKTGSLRFR